MLPPRRSLGEVVSRIRWIQHSVPLLLILGSILFASLPFLWWAISRPGEWWTSKADSIDRTKNARLRRKFFYFVWDRYAASFDKTDAAVKDPLLRQAEGTVLEIGAGLGQNIKYYNRERVSKIILVEPNPSMHHQLEQRAEECGYKVEDGTLQILGCGGSGSDEAALKAKGVKDQSIDTIVLVHVLCGIPRPQSAIELYRRLLRSKGQLLFYEHVKSEDTYTARVQSVYTRWIWSHLFDGCHMDRPTGEWLFGGDAGTSAGTGGKQQNSAAEDKELSEAANGLRHRTRSSLEGQGIGGRWSLYEVTTPQDQNRYSCLPQIIGRCVKP